jgi:hypothetical protein
MALPATFSVSGFFDMINLTLRPFPLRDSVSRNSASLLAQQRAVDFYDPYSSIALLITLFSPMYSIKSF